MNYLRILAYAHELPHRIVRQEDGSWEAHCTTSFDLVRPGRSGSFLAMRGHGRTLEEALAQSAANVRKAILDVLDRDYTVTIQLK